MSLIDKQGAHLRPQDEMSFVVQSNHSLKDFTVTTLERNQTSNFEV